MNLKQIAAVWLGVSSLLPASAVWAANVDVSAHDIGGQVIGDKGPEAGVWVIADFKTDREIEGRLDVYQRQVSMYMDAVAAATGRAVRGVLVRV